MGITGLLPFIKNSCRPVNLRDFKGATVAIDAYSWLHKGAFSCAEKLVKGEKTDGYVHYCVKQLNMLLDIGVKPIMVFDGCNLESKAVTERKRRENRERTRQKGKEYLCQGKIKEARECFQRCVDVTPEMAYEVIQVCKSKGIDYVVAPYEADAQLAYLNIANICQIVITEDSDLVLFGCEKILFKMDSCGGGMLYEKQNLPKSFGINAEKMSFDKFRYMCILSGCDYLPSLPGIGLAKACKFFTLVRNPDLHCVLPKLPSYLKMPKLIVSPEYIESFIKANNTFLYQLVFCPRKKALVPLSPYPEGVDASNMEYAGRYFPDELAQQIAMGDVNVKTLKKFEGFSPPPKKIGSSSSASKSSNSIWSRENFEVKSQKSSQELKTFFNIKQTSPKYVISPSVKKRTFCETDKDGNRDLQYQLLFSLYSSGSSQQKKHKPDDDDDEPVQNLNIQSPEHNKNTEGAIPKHVLPFQKAPKWATTAPLQKIVKSRFFVNSSKDTEKQQQTEKQSVCLDTTDREYHNSAQEFSENVQAPVSETAAASSSPEDPYVETVPPSTDATVPCPSPSSTENSMVATVTNDSLVVEAEEKENAQQRLLVGNFRHCVKPKGGYNHSLGSCGSSFNESFESLATEEDGDIRLHSSSDVSTFPSKKTAFGSPSRHASRRPLSDLECEVLSFDLDSSEDCASVSSVQGKVNSGNSIVSKSSKTRCRTVGLSRNRPKSVRQLSMQDTLFNFKFTKLPKMEAKNT